MAKKKSNYAFIDFQNMRLSIVKRGWKLDLKKFHTYLKDKLDVRTAFIFIGYMEENEKLYTMLRDFGYTLIFKPIIKQKGVIKGNVDAELVLHAMIEYNNYTQAIIVTGDGDFHCLIEYLEKNKKLRKLCIPNKKRFSSLLRSFLKYALFMDSIKEVVSQKKEGH